MSEIVDELVWKRSVARKIFQTQRLWPTFIGAKVEAVAKETKGLLPVYLWPEQLLYLQEKKFDILTEAGSLLKKRKRSQTDSDEDHNVLQIKSKRIKSGILAKSLQFVVERFASVVSWLFGSSKNIGNILDDDKVECETDSQMSQIKSDTATNNDSAETDISSQLPVSNLEDNIKVDDDVVSMETSIGNCSADAKKPNNAMNKREMEKQLVFTTLQEAGYFIGPGDVYGGEYSLYKADDPTYTHSAAVVRVLPSKMISVKEILAYSRVQNQVAKNAMFAFVSEVDDIHKHDKNTSSDSSSDSSSGGSADSNSSSTVVGGKRLEAKFLTINFKNISERYS